MLLRHTPKEIKERNALTINPAKTCQPVGAMYAALGIHNCLPHSHGSQGCCSYHRSALTRHYKEPVMAGTSSFTEGSSVFGGQANLIQAIENMFAIYEPEIIAIHTTCLSETIGDDVSQICQKARDDKKVPIGKHLINCSTPSYVGSHITGYSNMIKGIVDYFSKSTGETKNQINIIPGWVEPSDMREIKRITTEMGIKFILFPDTSDVLDAPQTGKHAFYPKGGVTVSELEITGDSVCTFALGGFASREGALLLERKNRVKYKILDIPIGISATDRFVTSLSDTMQVKVPESIEDERGRVLDIVTDMHQYLAGKRVALFGDPDTLFPLTEFLLDLDMIPVHIISGTPGNTFSKSVNKLLKDIGLEANVRNGQNADLFLLHQWIKNEPVDLLIGNTYGKYIARDEDIPFLRIGFPILDRIGHSYFPITGYHGAMRILEKILNALMDRQDRDAPEYAFELVM